MNVVSSVRFLVEFRVMSRLRLLYQHLSLQAQVLVSIAMLERVESSTKLSTFYSWWEGIPGPSVFSCFSSWNYKGCRVISSSCTCEQRLYAKDTTSHFQVWEPKVRRLCRTWRHSGCSVFFTFQSPEINIFLQAARCWSALHIIRRHFIFRRVS